MGRIPRLVFAVALRPMATNRRPGRIEFTMLLAMSMALAALGIDIMLPALPALRTAFDLPSDSTAVAGIVTAYFLGLAVGQLFYGPLSDRFGRKPVLMAGFAVYGIGALGAAFAPSLSLLFVARLVWGFGAAGSRVVSVAIVRDTYAGDRMARAMSFIMAIFILVPVVAPTLGAGILAVADWRWVFGACAAWVVVVAVWSIRLPETLDPSDRLELSVARLRSATRFVVTNRTALGYTLALTALFGVFTSYLGSAEIIISEVFDRGDAFPLIFGALAAVMGVAMLANANLVERVGVRRMVTIVLGLYVAVAALLTLLSVATGGHPPFWLFAPAMAAMLSCHALLIPNFNSIAMEPMGEVAGTASSAIGAFSTAVGALLGALLDRTFDGSVLPLALGFLGYGLIAAFFVWWAERPARSAAEAVVARR